MLCNKVYYVTYHILEPHYSNEVLFLVKLLLNRTSYGTEKHGPKLFLHVTYSDRLTTSY